MRGRFARALRLVGLGVMAGLVPASSAAAFDEGEGLRGFSSVVTHHVEGVMGLGQLPQARGEALESGLVITITMEQVAVFDQQKLPLRSGRIMDSTRADECERGCSAVLYEMFLRRWLAAAVEAVDFSVEIPQRLVLAAHRDLPTETMLQVAYAASQTRPIQPPQLMLLVNGPGGLQAQPFFMAPPWGLASRQGSGVLGLSLQIAKGHYRVRAVDPSFTQGRDVTSLDALAALMGEIKRRYPGKEAVVVIPQPDVSVGELITVVDAINAAFPTLVFSTGPIITTP